MRIKFENLELILKNHLNALRVVRALRPPPADSVGNVLVGFPGALVVNSVARFCARDARLRAARRVLSDAQAAIISDSITFVAHTKEVKVERCQTEWKTVAA